MKRSEFADFYIMGLEFSGRDNPPTMFDANSDEIDPEGSPNEYAFYFAKQCVSDVNSRHRKDWGKMAWLKWALFYRLPSLVKGVFEKKAKP